MGEDQDAACQGGEGQDGACGREPLLDWMSWIWSRSVGLAVEQSLR
jgi:hypothetical protein